MNSHKLFFYKQNLLVTIDGDWLIWFCITTKVTVGASTNLVFVCDSLLVNFMLDLIPWDEIQHKIDKQTITNKN